MPDKKPAERTLKGKKAYVETYRGSMAKDTGLNAGGRAHTAAMKKAAAADRRVNNPSPQQRTKPKK